MNRMREIRQSKNLSGVEVATSLDISAQYYYDLEKGKRNLGAELASKIADYFGVSTDYLLGKTTSDPIKNHQAINVITGLVEKILSESPELLSNIESLNEEKDQKNDHENSEIETIAAHHDGDEWTEEELEEIERFKEFVKMKRAQRSKG
ncbi:helix-turn-helix domain-containing protein [Paenibacillus sp. FSL L8-0506]|uniref:helix-turn-helix domain-containing protein n=1 Tax=Paenibacillus sp. FSL L8-0506 TaxID=2975335 RepID=UPI0030F55350